MIAVKTKDSSRNAAKYNKTAKVGEQIALFAKKIEFVHPTTNELLTFELDLPNRYPFTIFK